MEKNKAKRSPKSMRPSQPMIRYGRWALVWLIVGLLIVVSLYQRHVAEQDFLRTALATEGMFTELKRVDAKSDAYRATVHFVDENGAMYTHSTRFYGNDDYTVGSKVEVFYNPANPHHAMIKKDLVPSMYGFGCFVIVGVGIILLGFYCGFIAVVTFLNPDSPLLPDDSKPTGSNGPS